MKIYVRTLWFLLPLALLTCALSSAAAGQDARAKPFGFSTPTTLPGVIDRSYNMPLLTTGGSGVVSSCSIAVGALPAGLSIFPTGSECLISGTPLAVGTFRLGVEATDTSSPSQTALHPYALTIRPALVISTTRLPNALLNYPYAPSAPLTATGGLPPYTWQLPGTASGECSGLPAGTSPPGLILNAETGVLSGPLTAASTTDSDYTFQVCVQDTGNLATPAGAALPNIPPSNNFVVNVLNPVLYVPDNDVTCLTGVPPPCAGFIQIVRTDTKTLDGIILLSFSPVLIGADITSGAVSPDGTRLYLVASDTSEIGVVDTITNSILTTFPVPGGGESPVAIAISPDGNYAYVLDKGSSDLTIFSRQNISQFAVIKLSSAPVGIAFKPDGSRAYVSLSNGSLAIVNTHTHAQLSGSPFTLGSSGQLGIAVVQSAAPGSATILAYVAVNGAVDVLDVTSDPAPGPLSVLTTVPLPSASTALAADPSGDHVYVGFADYYANGVDEFAVIDNTLEIPAQIAGSPFSLPDPSMPAYQCPYPTSVAFPPINSLISTQAQAYFAAGQPGCPVYVEIIDGTSPTPTKDPASPLSLISFADYFTMGTAAIPIPK
jgi:DNA-binding beta-propeller fold protein YncE